MGIHGLHQSTKHLIQKKHMSAFLNKRVCIDASGWIIRGGVGASRELYTNPEFTGKPWVDFAMTMVTMLDQYNITPIFVFDGKRLDLKQDTSEERQTKRQTAFDVAKAFESAGDIEQAEKKWKQVFEATAQMTDDLQAALEYNQIEYVMAENEADQQMASMVLQGDADAVITEDSDMVAYGVPCIIFKLQLDGTCDVLDTTMEYTDEEDSKRKITVQLHTLTRIQKALVCTFAGNDYISSPAKGLGFKKIYNLLRRVSTWDEAVSAISDTTTVCTEYLEKAKRVFDVFMFCHRYSKTGKVSRMILM